MESRRVHFASCTTSPGISSNLVSTMNNRTFDVDASVIESEKEKAKVTHKWDKGYQPQTGFLFEDGLMLEDKFRGGNVPVGASAVGFVKKCFTDMSSDKFLAYLRADNALYQAGVINYCFECKVLFTITAD